VEHAGHTRATGAPKLSYGEISPQLTTGKAAGRRKVAGMADDLGREPVPAVASGCRHPNGLLTPVCRRKHGDSDRTTVMGGTLQQVYNWLVLQP
jgi:hypothetical protein